MFVSNWRRVLTRSYALWCVYIAGVLGLAPYFVPYLDGLIPRWLSILILLISPLGRIIDQKGLSDE